MSYRVDAINAVEQCLQAVPPLAELLHRAEADNAAYVTPRWDGRRTFGDMPDRSRLCGL
jgi:hypothetical protein